MIEFHIEPGVVMTWADFQATRPPFSIALDGYVNGPPDFVRKGPYANFDHHAGVNRLSTRSTCGQVYYAITLGLFATFQKEGQPYAHVYINDIDQDVCMACWLLKHSDQLNQLRSWQPLGRLLLAEDSLDTTGGAYPIDPEWLIAKQIAWVFEPYTTARSDGRLSRMDAKAMQYVLEIVEQRIFDFIEGRGGRVDLDTRYQELGGGPDWKLIAETGMYARTQLFADGFHAFVACRDNGDGTYTYSIGKMSPFVSFPILKIYERLNDAENITDPNDAWGGTRIIGGSPRKSRSRLTPQEVEQIVNGCVEEQEFV